jgi:CO/xanthine dehydrogenase Mo-binding subunit
MSGALNGLAELAAQAFGIERERVRIVRLDSLSAPATPYSGGSTITYSVGPAVLEAATIARERALAVAAGELEVAKEDLVVVPGRIEVRGSPGRGIDLELVARLAADGGRYLPVEGIATNLPPEIAPLSAAAVAEVDVDQETGVVRARRLVVAQDVGRAINKALVTAQIHGGAIQGLGWALFEQVLADERGSVLSGSLLDYALPTAPVSPSVEAEVVEVPAPHGPLGARGVGEGSVVPTPAAIANAVAHATGRRFYELPLTPDRVWHACRGEAGGPSGNGRR